MSKYLPDHDARILKLGCNVGRNLEALRAEGYRALEGVEISQPALELLARWGASKLCHLGHCWASTS